MLGPHDHVEAAPGPDKLAAPLQPLSRVEECTSADADFFLCLIRRKDPPARGKQAGSVGGQGRGKVNMILFDSSLRIRLRAEKST